MDRKMLLIVILVVVVLAVAVFSFSKSFGKKEKVKPGEYAAPTQEYGTPGGTAASPDTMPVRPR